MKLIKNLFLYFEIIMLIDLIICELIDPFETPEGISKFEEETHSRINNGEIQNIDTDKILLYFYNTSANDFVSMTSTNMEKILEQDFYDTTKNFLFYFTGQGCSHSSPVVLLSANNLIKAKKYNVVYVEIIHYCPNVYDCILNSRSMGRALSKPFMKFIHKYQVSPDRIEFHGHCLGAIAAAEAAKGIEPKIGLLAGIDPHRCGGFFKRGYAQHTTSLRSDAQYNSDILWNSDTEIILNHGLRLQPGCKGILPGLEKIPGCSHIISMFHWTHMINNPELFYAVECNEIRCNYSSIVSNVGPNFREKGTFYLRTLPAAPFGMGLDGVKNIIPTRNSTFINKTYFVLNYAISANYDMCKNLS